MKIAYFGSPSFSATLLEKLILDKSLGVEIVLVVTQPDKPVGRKMIITPSPVKVVAQKYGIPVFDNLKLVYPEERREIRNSKSSSNDKIFNKLEIENLDLNKNFKLQISNLDLCLVYAYGFKQLIPFDLLRAPKMQFEIGEGKTSGFVNVHPSLLPLYRGSSPIAYPILLGENKTGVSLFVLDEKMDHGPIISQEEMEITLTDVRPDMEKKLTDLGFKMIKKFLNSLIRESVNSLILKPQLHEYTTRSPYMTKDDGFIPLPVLQKALRNEPLIIQELPQIMRKYLSRHPVAPRHPREDGDPGSPSVIPSVSRGIPFKTNNSVEMFDESGMIIYNFWRGMSPWPGLWTLIQPPRLDMTKDDKAEPGEPPRLDTIKNDRTSEVKLAGKRLKIINLELYNFTTLKLLSVQLEGKSPVDFATFQKAYRVFT